MIGSAPDWLARLPAGTTFVLWALALVVVAAAVRTGVARTRAGRRTIVVMHGVENSFLALLLAAMLALSFLQIVLRNVAHSGLVWIDPLLRHLLLWIGFAGATLATRLERHIHIDVLTRSLPPAVNRIVRRVTNAGAAFVCLLLADATLRLVVQEADAESTSFLDLPTWILQTVMPLACLVMSYRFLYRTLGTGPSAEPTASAAPAMPAAPAAGTAYMPERVP